MAPVVYRSTKSRFGFGRVTSVLCSCYRTPFRVCEGRGVKGRNAFGPCRDHRYYAFNPLFLEGAGLHFANRTRDMF
jgi:hypothetical protein